MWDDVHVGSFFLRLHLTCESIFNLAIWKGDQFPYWDWTSYGLDKPTLGADITVGLSCFIQTSNPSPVGLNNPMGQDFHLTLLP